MQSLQCQGGDMFAKIFLFSRECPAWMLNCLQCPILAEVNALLSTVRYQNLSVHAGAFPGPLKICKPTIFLDYLLRREMGWCIQLSNSSILRDGKHLYKNLAAAGGQERDCGR
jgi:hypothetical protein